MSYIRGFSSQLSAPAPPRDLEVAPGPMRQELVDAFYYVAGQTGGRLDVDRDLYFIIEQSLGCDAAGNPAAGKRQRIGRDFAQTEWQRAYDLIERLWPEYHRVAADERYREAINRILAAYSVAWDLGLDGHLHRVLPNTVIEQAKAALEELSEPRFAAALQLYDAAVEAYDCRPRRDRDACTNMFDALESAAKEVFQLPDATFGQVLATARAQSAFTGEVISALEAINTLRNRHFGHGMTAPFQLTPPEVDFAYTSCVGAILLFTRQAHPSGTPPVTGA